MTHSPRRECDTYDAVVVGASFAGLSFASGAAARGLRVLVLERDAVVGGVVRTTGILFSDVLDVLDVPARYLMNAVRRMRIQPPGQPAIAIEARAYRFFMADVTGMLQWMAEQAVDHGAEVRCGATFLDASPDADGVMRITVHRPLPRSGDDATPVTPREEVRAVPHRRGRDALAGGTPDGA